MNRLKLIFNQTLMISTGILFGLGIQALLARLCGEQTEVSWQWFIPLSIVLTGFLCAIPSVIFLDEEDPFGLHISVKITLHFLAILGVVSLCGRLFGWYDSFSEWLVIAVMYVIIYAFVWAATFWLAKSDANKINDALKDMQDEE
ncbi:MAG: DUF3021 domain-containing protein [Lachnospiraceae bacterium]|nr:DUF3021 domain-containing protein [Lachnospiraceae bacterium]